jgi:hypothetical protein
LISESVTCSAALIAYPSPHPNFQSVPYPLNIGLS